MGPFGAAVVLGTLTFFLLAHSSGRKLECTIGILDVSQFEDAGSSKCDADRRLHTITGQIFANASEKTGESVGESHIYGQHASPYWVEKAIRASKYYTADLANANAIFVDDYCLMISSTAFMHSGHFNDGFKPGPQLESAYRRIAATSRYLKRRGMDFVFFSPHPLTGISQYPDFSCNVFGRALHIVVEATQRYVCSEAEARGSFLVVPYSSPHFVEDQAKWPEKDILIHFLGACGGDFHGKHMRVSVVESIRQLNVSGVSVACSDNAAVSHEIVRTELRRSIFCLLIPGDTVSSRRLTEGMLSGCIPVFLGPPWHATPLSKDLFYPDFSVVYDVEEFLQLRTNASILQEPTPDKAPANVFDHRWWIPPEDISNNARKVQNIPDVVQDLQNMPNFEIARLQRKGAAIRSLFRYRHTDLEEDMFGPGTASDAIIQHICQRILLYSSTD